MPVFIVVFSAYETGFLIRGFGSLCNLGLSKKLVFLCKGTKPENSAKPNSRTVCRFSPWYAFSPLIPAVWGFGSLYNLGIPKEQRFFLERHKSEKLQNLITI